MNFIVVLYTDDLYGNSEYTVFRDLAGQHGICINFTGSPTAESVDSIYDSMTFTLGKSITVVYLGDLSGAVNVLTAEADSQTPRPHTSKITWVFSSNIAEEKEIEKKLHKDDTIICIGCRANVNNQLLTDYYDKLLDKTLTSPISVLLSDFGSSLTVSDNGAQHVIDSVISLTFGFNKTVANICGNYDFAQCAGFPDNIHAAMLGTIRDINISITDSFAHVEFYSYENKFISFDDQGTQDFKEIGLQLHYVSRDIIKVHIILIGSVITTRY